MSRGLIFNGGINWDIIRCYLNKYPTKNLKLSLFLGLGCKAMKDVILHHPDEIKSIGNLSLGGEPQESAHVNLRFFEVSIEAIPEKLTEDEIDRNIMNMTLTWKYAYDRILF